MSSESADRSAPRVVMASETHPGRRPANEDSAFAEKVASSVLAIVADGMGGHAAGGVASRVAVNVLRREWERHAGESCDPAWIRGAVRAAHEELRARAEADPECRGMGTTLVALFAEGTSCRIASVGDSRAYVVSADAVAQVTRDHTGAAEAAERGVEAGEYARALTRALGTDPEVEVDVYPEEGPPFESRDGEVVLLCSDGVHGVLSDVRIAEEIRRTPDVRMACSNLLSLAIEAGSTDNVSAVAVEFGRLRRQGVLRAPRRSADELVSAPLPTASATRVRPPAGLVGAAVGLAALLVALVTVAVWSLPKGNDGAVASGAAPAVDEPGQVATPNPAGSAPHPVLPMGPDLPPSEPTGPTGSRVVTLAGGTAPLSSVAPGAGKKGRRAPERGNHVNGQGLPDRRDVNEGVPEDGKALRLQSPVGEADASTSAPGSGREPSEMQASSGGSAAAPGLTSGMALPRGTGAEVASIDPPQEDANGTASTLEAPGKPAATPLSADGDAAGPSGPRGRGTDEAAISPVNQLRSTKDFRGSPTHDAGQPPSGSDVSKEEPKSGKDGSNRGRKEDRGSGGKQPAPAKSQP